MSESAGLELQPSWGRRLMGMEGLRGIAAVSVLVGHVQSHLAPTVELGGPTDLVLGLLLNGLTLFFALSGFLLFRPFATAVITGQPLPSARRFLQNRALRIYPAYVVILLLVALVFGAAYTSTIGPNDGGIDGVESSVGYLTNPLTLLANLTMLHTLIPGTIKTGLGVSWSLTVELVFYLVLPVLAWCTYRLSRGRGHRGTATVALLPAATLLVVGVVASLVSDAIDPSITADQAFYYAWGGNWYAVFARSFINHADLFAFGMVAALVLALVEQGLVSARQLTLLKFGAVCALVFGVCGGKLAPLSTTWWAMACGSLILLVVLPTSNGRNNLLSLSLELVPLRYLGLISYSMYLWHLPVLWMLEKRGLTFEASRAGLLKNVFLVLAVSVVVSSITYYGVEKPALRFKSSMTRPRTRAAEARPEAETLP